MLKKKTVEELIAISAGDDCLAVHALEKAGKLHDPNTRWEDGVNHHPKSLRLMEFLLDYDFCKYDDYFCWKKGGDGDNGETLMYQLDAFFEMLDKKGETL